MLIRIVALLLLLLPLSAIATATATTIVTQSPLLLLLSDLEEIKAEYDVPAIGLTLVKDGQVLYADSFGITDINSKTPVDNNTQFRLGSVSKSFAGLAALKAQQLGYFKLTDTVSQYLGEPFLDNPWQQTHPVKIVHLLEHTAGFFDISDAEFSHDEADPIDLQSAFQLSPSSRTIVRPPGKHASYSNLGAPIVAYIIEKVSGLSYESFVKQQLLQPLGMHHSSFFKDEYVAQHLVSGHDSSGQSVIPYWHIAYRPFGALNASPVAMAAFLQLLINRGEYGQETVLQPQDIARLENPQSTLAAQHGLDFGYGLGVYASLYEGITLYGHGGTSAGHLAEYRYSSEHGIGFVLLININNERALNKLSERINAFLTADITADSVQTKTIVGLTDTEDLQQYQGYYQYASSRAKAVFPILNVIGLKRMTLKGDHLQVRGFVGSAITLYPAGNGLFAESEQTTATAAIMQQPNGGFVLQTSNDNYQQISFLHYWCVLLLVAFVVVVILMGLLYSLIWLPFKLLGKLPGAKNTWTRLLPLISLPILVLPLFLSRATASDSYPRWLLDQTGYLFIVLTLACVWLAVKAMTWQISRFAKVNLTLTCLVNLMIGSYLLVWQVI
jgi:CubicO group peptidase (beta-lactamase class C family)